MKVNSNGMKGNGRKRGRINHKRAIRWLGMAVAGAMLVGCGASASGISAETTAGSVAGAVTEAAAGTVAETAAGNRYKAETAMEGARADAAAPAGGMPQVPGALAGEAGITADGLYNNTLDEGYSIPEQYQEAYPPEDWNTEEYSPILENGYKRVVDEPLSTFSVDVDTASYGNIRRMIRNKEDIPADAVRIEEMINYFNYDYPEPQGDEPFSVTTEYSDCPWNEDSRLLLIGLQAKEIDFSGRPASNLVFLLDVSGSMYGADRLPLVQKAFTMLTENLDGRDKVSIVTYAGYESVVLDGVSGTNQAEIAAAIDDLEAGGSTAGAAGIEKAYELAQKNFIPGGNNRVILATDGDLNVGITSEGELISLIKEKKKSGVHLSVLGVGSDNIKDNKMEALADNGDGNYNYLDSIYEAKKVLVDEMGGTLITVAKDVKIQVEFNPEKVAGYRLIGYENRLLNQEDFNNDKVDAGEIGSGHSVTALYEIIPAGSALAERELKYQTPGSTTGSSELLTVNLRYKAPNGDTSKLLEYPVEADSYTSQPSENLTFAAAVAEFGMVLRDSENKGTADYASAAKLAESCIHQDSDDYRKEFLQLVKAAEAYR